MRYKLICCEVLREAVIALPAAPYCWSVFTQKRPTTSRPAKEQLQEMIEEAEKAGIYDAVLLGFGLCGMNSRAEKHFRSLLYQSSWLLHHFGQPGFSGISEISWVRNGAVPAIWAGRQFYPINRPKPYRGWIGIWRAKKNTERECPIYMETLHPKGFKRTDLYWYTRKLKSAYIELLKNEADKTDKKPGPRERWHDQSLIWGNWVKENF